MRTLSGPIDKQGYSRADAGKTRWIAMRLRSGVRPGFELDTQSNSDLDGASLRFSHRLSLADFVGSSR